MKLLSWPKEIKEIIGEWRRNGWRFSAKTKHRFQEFIVVVQTSLPELFGPPTLTYAAAIDYFVTHRPDDENIQKGALLRQSLRDGKEGIRLIQVFLDKDDKLACMPDGKPYGRQLVVKELDQELQDAFGNTDLVIVE